MPQLNAFTWISIFAIGAMVVNSIGIMVIYRNKEWAMDSLEYFMCFAAGMLISSPLLMAFPEALKKNSAAGLAALLGFVFMFFSNRLIQYLTKQKELAFGITAVEGIGIHSFLDGIIYTVTFSASTFVGLLAGTGLVVHEFAEGVITFSVLLKSGMKPKKAVVFAFIVAALTTPIGAFAAYPFVSHLSDSLLGLALGFTVGVMIYISAAHLLPEVQENERKHSHLAFILGILVAVLVMFTER